MFGLIATLTNGQPGRLWAFGLFATVATGMIGYAFSQATATPQSLQEQQRAVRDMPMDSQRMATAQQERLSHMIKDMVDGRGDDHWAATMRGTLVPHPNQENKTIGAENEKVAREVSKSR